MTFPPNTTALDASVNLSAIHSEMLGLGFDTALRYCAPGSVSSWKVITPDEAKSMQANGIKLALIYESTAQDALDGASEGSKAGAFAASYAPTVGLLPGTGCIIYATADFDVAQEQIATVLDYAKAFAAALGSGYGLGFYANGITCDALFDAGVICSRWITQSADFAGSQDNLAAGRYEIAQRLPATVAGISVDPDSLRVAGLDIGARVPFSATAPDNPANASVLSEFESMIGLKGNT